jgi:hypothetical protein
MHSFFDLKSVALRRIVLLLFSPIVFFLFFICRISSAARGVFPDFQGAFLGIWNGIKMKDEVLPCPFCGGRCNPDGWMTQSGASGPSCEECGATAYNESAWNRRTAPKDS